MKEGKEGKKKENKKGDSHHPPPKKTNVLLDIYGGKESRNYILIK